MLVTLTIIRYPRQYVVFALFAMALHRLPLRLNRNISFFKLLGSGKNGTFDKHPEWQQWGILAVHNTDTSADTIVQHSTIKKLYGNIIHQWISFFNCETWTIFLEPIEGHGQWDGKMPFGQLPRNSDYTGPIATLTRATIRFSKLKAFWANVGGVATQMATAKGFITSFGIGEMPYIKQATFSVWNSKAAMKQFAYSMQEHADVIRKTRQDKWYSEDLFVRFRPLKTLGNIKGHDPLAGKL